MTAAIFLPLFALAIAIGAIGSQSNPHGVIFGAPERCGHFEARFAPENKEFCDAWFAQRAVAK